MNNNGWMNKHSLGKLASTTDHPKQTKKDTNSSVDKRRLIEEYNDGMITLEEFQIELSVLNSIK